MTSSDSAEQPGVAGLQPIGPFLTRPMDDALRKQVLDGLKGNPAAEAMLQRLEPVLERALADIARQALERGAIPGTAEEAAARDAMDARAEVMPGIRAELVDAAGPRDEWQPLDALARWLMRHGHKHLRDD